MVAFNDFHKQDFIRWIKARSPDFDHQTIDFQSMWDSSLSISENFHTIEEKLAGYGLVKNMWAKREYKEWVQRANDWYADELRENQQIESTIIEPIEYAELPENYAIGFSGPEVVYAIVRPRLEIDYEKATIFLGLIEDDLALLQKTLGGV